MVNKLPSGFTDSVKLRGKLRDGRLPGSEEVDRARERRRRLRPDHVGVAALGWCFLMPTRLVPLIEPGFFVDLRKPAAAA